MQGIKFTWRKIRARIDRFPIPYNVSTCKCPLGRLKKRNMLSTINKRHWYCVQASLLFCFFIEKCS